MKKVKSIPRPREKARVWHRIAAANCAARVNESHQKQVKPDKTLFASGGLTSRRMKKGSFCEGKGKSVKIQRTMCVKLMP